MNEIVTTICGNVATAPRHQITRGGQPLTSFRLASTPRRYDPEVQGYVDGDTTWINVSCWGGLAFNANRSLRKGQPVVVTGTLRTRDWEADGKTGKDVDLTAYTVGHDLRRGVTGFERVTRSGAPAPGGATTAEADGEPGAEVADDGTTTEVGEPVAA
ncbi:single-stranded DNA-binding protein [Angustibacter peucedani]